MIKNFYNKYILIILGFLIFTLYFWSRFLRERTSKILPLNLNIISFFILLYICCIFTYILISLLKSSSNKNIIIEKIIDWLFIPIMEFDNYLKSFSIIKNSYKKFLNYIIPKLEYSIIKTNLFYIIFWILPRLILLTALFVDVFIYKQLHYKYMVVLFGLLLFFNRYVKYSLKNTKESMTQELLPFVHSIITDYYPGIHPAELGPDYDPDDEEQEPDVDDKMSLPLDIFIKYQTESIVYRNVINYTMMLSSKKWRDYILIEFADEFVDKFKENTTNFVYEKRKNILEPQIKQLLKISLILEYYNLNTNFDKKLKNIKILIFLNYLLCWLYVLIISIHTLNLYELILVLNKTWLLIENPFTQDFICEVLYENFYKETNEK